MTPNQKIQLQNMVESNPRLAGLTDASLLHTEIRKPIESRLKIGSFVQDRTLDWLLGVWKSGLVLDKLELFANGDPSVLPYLDAMASQLGQTRAALISGFKRIFRNLTVRDGIDMGLPESQAMTVQLQQIMSQMGVPFTEEDVAKIQAFGYEKVPIDILQLGWEVSSEDCAELLETKDKWRIVRIVDMFEELTRWVVRYTITNGLEERTERLEYPSKPTEDQIEADALSAVDSMNG